MNKILTTLKPWFIGVPIALCIYKGVDYLNISHIAKGIILLVLGLCCLIAWGCKRDLKPTKYYHNHTNE
jgi:hypothetical protein